MSLKRLANQPHGVAVPVHTILVEYQRSQRFLGLARSTKTRYASCLRTFDRLILANNKTIFEMLAHKVDYSLVDYVHRVLSHKYSQGTIKYYFSIMSTVWEHALRTGRVALNPWANANIKVDNERDTTWSPEEVKKTVEICTELGYHVLALYILFGYETGIRMWSDLRRLTWDMIKQNENGGYILDFTVSKTGVHLMLPLSNVILAALQSTGRTEGNIFNSSTGKLLTQSGLNFQFQKVKKLANLPDALQLRDLRRTAVTELVNAGATMSEITAVTGWRNPSGVINRYARIRLKTAENAMKKRWEDREPKASEVSSEPQFKA